MRKRKTLKHIIIGIIVSAGVVYLGEFYTKESNKVNLIQAGEIVMPEPEKPWWLKIDKCLEEVAEQRAREFFKESFKLPDDYEYETILSGPHPTKMLKNHIVFSAFGKFQLPLAFVYVVVGKDKNSFVMPDDFNEIILRETITVDNEDAVLNVLGLYLTFQGRGRTILLSKWSDIPFSDGLGKNPTEFSGIIDIPTVNKVATKYYVTFFSWREIGGILEKLKIVVDSKGQVAILSKTRIANQVGSYSVLQ